MAAAQFALFAREQDIALGARFAVEMVRYQALSSHGAALTAEVAWTWSCLGLSSWRVLVLDGQALHHLER
jgi:hypothetical protein